MFKRCKDFLSDLLPKKSSANFHLNTDYNTLLTTDFNHSFSDMNGNKSNHISYDGDLISLNTDFENKFPAINSPPKPIGDIQLNTNSPIFTDTMNNTLDLPSFLNSKDKFDNALDKLQKAIADSPLLTIATFKNSTIDKSRLQIEKEIVGTELPQFILIKSGKTPCFVGDYCSTSTNDRFTLRLELPDYYPDQMPKLFITSPITLRKSGGGRINDMGASHDYHTLGTGPRGCIQICHFDEVSWEASKTCVAVLIKGLIWLEAYCVSLLTSLSIAEIIDQWHRRQ